MNCIHIKHLGFFYFIFFLLFTETVSVRETYFLLFLQAAWMDNVSISYIKYVDRARSPRLIWSHVRFCMHLPNQNFYCFFSLGYTTKRITLNTINFYFYFFLFVIWWYLPEVIFLVTYFVNKAIWWWFKLAHHIRQTNRICWITRWRVNSNKHCIYIHDIF